MAFADLPESATVGIMVRFTGVDYVFADFEQPSLSGWGSASGTISIDGETYTWSQSVHMPRAVGMGTEYDPNKHRLTAGGMDLEFRLPGTQDPFSTNPWLGLLNKDPFRSDGDYAVLNGTIEADHTSAIPVVQTTGWATSGHLHVGIERIEYSTLTATTFGTPITRGTYGSKAQQHRAAFPGSLVGGSGAQVTLYPTVWAGRIATVHLVRGKTIEGVFVPDSTTPENENIDKRQRYVVVAAKANGDNSLARVTCNSIDGLQDIQIAQRLPRSNAGLMDAEERLIRLDDTIKNLTYRWSRIDNTNGNTMDEPIISTRIQRDIGSGVPGDVLAGWYTLAELQTFLTFTILENLNGPSWFGWSNGPRSRITTPIGADEIGVAFLFDLNSAPSQFTTDCQVALSIDPARGDSVWRALGFEDPAQALSGTLTTTTVYFGVDTEAESTRKFPRFYLPRFPGATAIRSWGLEDPQTPHAIPGYDDDDANAIGGYLRISDQECIGFSAVDTATYPGYTAFTVSERGALGSSLTEIYVEWGEDAEPIIQGLAFPNTSWPRVLLYLLLGGSGVSGLNDATYDEGWVGSGVYVDSDLVDKTSILALVAKLGDTLRDWAWFEATKLRDFVDSEGLLANAILAPIAGQMVARAITKLLEAEVVDSVATLTLAHQHADTGRRTYDDGENMISNALEVEGAWDHATDAPRHVAKTYQGTSVTSYGLRNKRSVKLQGVLSVAELKSRVEDLGIRYFSTRAFPRVVFGIPFANTIVWDVELMDVVEVTDDLMPAMSSGGAATGATRGLSSVACRVFKADHLLPAASEREAERGRLAFVTDKKDSSRYSHWAPSAQVNAVTGGGSTTLVCDDHALSGNESTSPRDVEYFDTARAGTTPKVRIYPVGDYAASITRTVQSVTLKGVDLSEIEVDSAVALTPPLIVEPIEYDDASITAKQKRYVYMSDGDHKLDGSSGFDLPFKYV
jgi:hypothetical protein